MTLKTVRRADLPAATLLADMHDVRAILRTSKATIYRLVQTQQLSNPVKLGKRSAWPLAEVEALSTKGWLPMPTKRKAAPKRRAVA